MAIQAGELGRTFSANALSGALKELQAPVRDVENPASIDIVELATTAWAIICCYDQESLANDPQATAVLQTAQAAYSYCYDLVPQTEGLLRQIENRLRMVDMDLPDGTHTNVARCITLLEEEIRMAELPTHFE